MSDTFSVPVIYIMYNRPRFTTVSFNIIKKIKPKNLYIVADGPKKDLKSDTELCKATRDIVEDITWDCAVTQDFSAENLGCKKRVSSGITNAFRLYEHAIILEDDCLPDLSFFPYCEELLNTYSSDKNIMHVSGCHFHKKRSFGTGSYYFSKFAHVWGWATWKRAWEKYDPEIKDWPEQKESAIFRELPLTSDERESLYQNFQNVFSGNIDTWDFQWVYNIIKNRGLCINPNKNLISNIGFHKEATHTADIASPFYKLKTYPIKTPLEHPKKITVSEEADALTASLHFGAEKQSFLNKKKRSVVKRFRKIKTFISKKNEL